MSAAELERDRTEAAAIVAKINADAKTRLGRLPSEAERERWSRVFALASVGLLAEPVELPASAKPGKASKPVPANTGKPRGPSPHFLRKSDRAGLHAPVRAPVVTSGVVAPSPETVLENRPAKPPQRKRPVVIEVGS